MSAIRTAENKSHDLGTAAKRFNSLYIGAVDADSDVSVAGSLTVDGSQIVPVDDTDLSSVVTASTIAAPSQRATKSFVESQVAAVIDAAPEALNTLNELAAALNDDSSIGATVTSNSAKLSGIENNATADQTGAEIKSLYEAEANTNAFTDDEKSKLSGLQNLSDLDGAAIKQRYEAEDDTNSFTDALKAKLQAIESSATSDQTGAEIKALYEAEANAFTDSLYSKLSGIESSATADQTGAEIKSLYESESDTNVFTDSDSSKLQGIESGATADQTGAEIKALYEAEANSFTDALYTKLNEIETGATADQTKADIDSLGVDSATVDGFTVGIDVPANAKFTDTTYSVGDGGLTQNDFTDALKTKLAGVESGATADQSASDIKSSYESNDDTNALTDSLKTKLEGIEASADVTDATNVSSAGAVMSSDTDSSSFGFVLDEDNLGSNSSTKVPTQSSVKSYVDTAVSGLVDSAPAALNTLNELSAALGGDDNFATTVSTSLGEKAVKTTQIIAGTALTGGGDLSSNRTLSVSGLTTSEFSSSSVISSTDSFSDVDSALMTAAAVADKIESYGYTTAASLDLDDYMPLTGGTFTGAVEVQGNLTIKGDLIQFENASNGTSESVSFADANIVVDADNPGSAVADGAGLTLEGGSGDDVTFQWNSTDGRMEIKEGSGFASLKVDSLISTSGTVEVTATSAQKLDHTVTFSVTGDVSTSSAVTTDFSSGSGSIVELSTSIADGSLNPSVLETAVPISKGGTGAISVSAARTALDVDQAGTDNSTDVTLASVSGNYLSISGQDITAGTVPVSLGGTGAATAAAARTALAVDPAGTDNSTDVTLANTNYLSISGQEITGGTVPVSSGGTGATTVHGARSALGVDAAGTDNSTNVTLSNTDYLNISGQQITAGTVPVSSGGTGATTSSAARTALGVDAAGTDNSTDVTLANTNYLSISGQDITGGTIPVSSGGTGAVTAYAARSNLNVDVAGTDNSTDVTLASVSDNYLSISDQDITAGTVPVSLGGTGATTSSAAREALGVDAAGTDNSTNVTLSNTNYLSVSGQEITGGTVPVSSGGTGATTALAARSSLDVDQAGTDNSTDVTLANTNYLSISGQEITGGTVPVSSGGTGSTTAASARIALDVDQAGTDNSTDVTLASVSDNYLSISGQVVTSGTVPVSLGGTGATTIAAAREALGLNTADSFDQGTAWVSSTSGSDTDITLGTEVDGHSGSWKLIYKIDSALSGGNVTSVSLAADYQVRPASRINKLKSLPDSIWNIPEDGVLQLR